MAEKELRRPGDPESAKYPRSEEEVEANIVANAASMGPLTEDRSRFAPGTGPFPDAEPGPEYRTTTAIKGEDPGPPPHNDAPLGRDVRRTILLPMEGPRDAELPVVQGLNPGLFGILILQNYHDCAKCEVTGSAQDVAELAQRARNYFDRVWSPPNRAALADAERERSLRTAQQQAMA